MATAPVPGRTRADDEANVILRITMAGKTLELQPAALTLQEKFVIRNSTGMPFEAFFTGGMNSVGEDSVAVLWWLARRANGEPNLPFLTFAEDWKFDPEGFDLEEVTPDEVDDRPEDSGPGSSTPSLA